MAMITQIKSHLSEDPGVAECKNVGDSFGMKL
jgi:hypothetical protein